MHEKTVERYLTDEELEALITQIEERELVRAPGDMAERILSAVDDCKDPARENRQEDTEPVEMVKEIQRPPENKRKTLMRYSLRVVLSAAASIAILFAMPAASHLSAGMEQRSSAHQKEAYERSARLQEERRREREDRKDNVDWLELCNRSTSGFCSILNDVTTNMLH